MTHRLPLARRLLALGCALALAAVATGCSWLREYRSRVRAEQSFASGVSAAERDDLAQAEKEFAEALRLEPESASLRARVGLAYMEMRPPQPVAALPYLQRAIERDGNQPFPVYLEALLAAAQLGRQQWARQVLPRAAKRFHDDALALNDIGYVLVDADELTADALPLLQRAVELEPRSGIIIDSLGWAYYRLGNLKRAAALLQQAVGLAGKDPEIQYHLGVVYADLGRIDQARAQFRRALEISPAFGRAHAALRALEQK